MSAAEMSLWTRRRSTTREDVQAALWRRRELVKTTSMRMTLHLIPASDFPIYIAAMRAVVHGERAPDAETYRREAEARRHHDRRRHGRARRRPEDAAGSAPRARRRRPARGMRIWLQYAWSAMRPAIVEGLICYGPPRGARRRRSSASTSGCRSRRRWIPTTRASSWPTRFLAAFGPATHRDFTKWSGLNDERDANPSSIVSRGSSNLSASTARTGFDPAPRSRCRSPTRVLDSRPQAAAGASTRSCSRTPRRTIWSSRASTSASTATRAGFRPSSSSAAGSSPSGFLEQRAKTFTRRRPAVRRASTHASGAGIHEETEALGRFLGARCDAVFSPP